CARVEYCSATRCPSGTYNSMDVW
nr:immunoglobulin heavy chain junction region [Macaca mulatta]MOW26523.1 immunoglobulin heavy chain junction region [Macaca mulatta]